MAGVPIDAETLNSPGWWMRRLLREQGERRDRLDRLARYYDGDPDLPWGPQNVQEMFRTFQRKARANWAELIVEAPRERMKIVGFRTSATADDPSQVDVEARRIWTANDLDAQQDLCHATAMSQSQAYTIVGGVDPEIGAPVVTIEDPRECITASDPARPNKVIAGLKVWDDPVLGVQRANVYTPGWVSKAWRDSTGVSHDMGGWEWMQAAERLPFPVVPITPFTPRPKLRAAPLGEFEPVIDDIDRINIMLLQRMTIAVLQAFKQMAVKGLAQRDEHGREIDYSQIFAGGPGAVWQIPGDAEMWESAAVDLTPILESVKADVRDLAAVTRTPMFYLFPDAANGSAEGASLQREGLVFKTTDRLKQVASSWQRTMSLAFLFSGDQDRADLPSIQALYAPPERFSMAEKYDAASKAQAAGVPWRTIMTDVLQFDPEHVERMEAERLVDQLSAPDPFGSALPAENEPEPAR